MLRSEMQLKHAQECIAMGGGAIDTLPVVIASIIKDESWRKLTNKEGQLFSSFPEFVEYKLWWGLETKYTRLIEFCKDHEECHRLLLEQLPEAGKRGRPAKDSPEKDGNTSFKQTANTSSTTLRRLKRDRPDLADQVIKGDLSAHAAAILAGFRKPSLTLQANNPEHAAERIQEVLGADFAAELGQALQLQQRTRTQLRHNQEATP